jgi:hypothetical protein
MADEQTTLQPQAPGPAKQSGYRVKSISVSLEIADKEYGNGNSGYANIQAHVDDTPIEQIDDVIDAGLSLFVACWEVILGGKLVVKLNSVTATETQQAVMNVRHRLAKVQAMLHDAHDHGDIDTQDGKQ